jgi:hypothetical protein
VDIVQGSRLKSGKGGGRLEVLKDGEDGKEAVDIGAWMEETDTGEKVIIQEIEVLNETMESEVSVSGCSGKDDDNVFSFLENIDNEKRDLEAEVRKGDRKRKWGETAFIVNNRGLAGTKDWEEKEKREKDNGIWRRKVSEGGQVKEDKIPLPENYRLGLEKRGEEVNNSSRNRNGFGTNKRALFPKEGKDRGEDKNWIATFNRGGCLNCKDERGELNHQGRTGEPVILIVGDEATPMMTGYTTGKEEEMACCWILKKEHLRLNEVGAMLRRINEDKREHDKEQGKRPHEFFLPNGSKILVSSYCHLRKEGIEGYINDFSNMVKDIWNVTKDTGIEVLPCCPVVFEGLDKVGGEQVSALRDWIGWLREEAGREEIEELKWTGGKEESQQGEQVTIFYRPVGVLLKSQKKESAELGLKGNMIQMVRGDRREVLVRNAMPAKELFRLTHGGKWDERDLPEEDEKKRGSFEEGISIEGEYSFSKAVEGFAKKAVKAGRYRGAYRFNLKDQMKVRMRRTLEDEHKVKVVTIGASEMGRIVTEWKRAGAGKVEVLDQVKVRGKLDRKVGLAIEATLEKVKGEPDCVVIGGPGNSLVEYGNKGGKGGSVERVVTVVRNQEGMVESIHSTFHLVDPVKLTMCERKVVAGVVNRLVQKCKELWPLVEIYYIGIFPRHIRKCCETKGHMGDEDPRVFNRSRMDLEEDILDEFRLGGEQVEYVPWWSLLGYPEEPSLEWVRVNGVVGTDGVHMDPKKLQTAAASLYSRLTGAENSNKRRKME